MNSIFVPKITLSTLIVIVVIYINESLYNLFIFDREAIINYEIWRLYTSSFVHLSSSHFIYNLIAFTTLSYFIEQKSTFDVYFFIYLLPLIIGIGLFLLLDTLIYFGGISGVNYALLFYYLLSFLSTKNKSNIFIYFILALIFLKILIEFFELRVDFFNLYINHSFQIEPISHLIGITFAFVLFKLKKTINKRI